MSTSNDSSEKSNNLQKRLRDALEQHRARELNEAMRVDASDVVESAELEHRVAAIMSQFDASFSAAPATWTTEELIGGLARLVVARLASFELTFFDLAEQAFFSDPDSLFRRGVDRAAGFGAADSTQAITPAALFVAREVVAALGAEPDGDTLAAALANRLGLDGEKRQPAPLLSDSGDKRLRSRVAERASTVGLPQSEVSAIVDVILKTLSSR